MTLTKEQISAQSSIENIYSVKMYPKSSSFQRNVLDFYIKTGIVTNSQLNSIKNPKFPIRKY